MAVVFTNPIEFKMGTSKAGSNVIKIPWAIVDIIVPLLPPTAFANTPADPPAKSL